MMQRNWIGRSRGRRGHVRDRGPRTSRSPCSPPGPTRCTARRSSWSPPTRRWPPSCARPSSARSCDAYLATGAQADRHRAAGRPTARRPASSWAGTRSTRSTASGSRSGRPTTCCPTTAPARSWPCPRTTSATWTSPARSGCRSGSWWTPASPDPAETGSATPGDGALVNSGPLDGLSKAEAIADDHRASWPGAGLGQAAVNYRLRDWLVSRQRFWGAPIPIVYCAGCGEVPVPDDQLPVRLPDLRGQDLAPKGVSPLAAADRLGEHRPARSAAARPSGTPTRWTRSSTRPGTSCATARRTTTDGRVRRRGGPPLGAGRPVRRRRRARDPAPAVQPVLHQGAVRHGHGRLRRAVHRAAEPGPGHQPAARRCPSRWATASTWASSWLRTASTRSG